MRACAIKREVNRIKAKYHTSDPYEVCQNMGISVLYNSMGNHASSCKGFFIENSRCKTIVLNSALPETTQRVILAHELGHAVLHSGNTQVSAFHDMSVMNMTDQFEYEANIFAAEFMIADEEVLEMVSEESDFFSVASCLGIPPEFLDFKVRMMKAAGYDIQAPIMSRADFLKRDITKPYDC